MTISDTPGSQGRPARSQRRAQLLGAAREVFTASGYHSASMEDIGSHAGVSKPVLYQHFPSKLELYLAVLDDDVADLLVTVQEAIQSSPQDNEARLAATIRAYFDFVDRGDQSFRLVFESDLMREPAVAARLEQVGRTLATLAAQAIAADTGLAQDEAMLLGIALTGMAQITARHWLSSGRQIPRAEAAHLIGQLSWRGIRAFPRSPASAPDAVGS